MSTCSQIVDKTILYNDKDGDGKISFAEFCEVLTDSYLLTTEHTINLSCAQVVASSDAAEKMVLPDNL